MPKSDGLDREILRRYRQGSSIKHLTKWVKDTQCIGATKAREIVEQAIYDSLPKTGGANGKI